LLGLFPSPPYRSWSTLGLAADLLPLASKHVPIPPVLQVLSCGRGVAREPRPARAYMSLMKSVNVKATRKASTSLTRSDRIRGRVR